MSALFNFESLLLVILLLICTCTYARAIAPGIIDRNKEGFLGLFWKFARIGERLSPYVALACVGMAIKLLLWNTTVALYTVLYCCGEDSRLMIHGVTKGTTPLPAARRQTTNANGLSQSDYD